MTLKILTPPGVEPVSLDQAKAVLRVTSADEDALIGALITAARERVEAELGLCLISTALREDFDGWTGRLSATGAARLSRGPLISVEAVRVADSDGTLQALDPALYAARPGSRPGRFVPAPGRGFPAPQSPDAGIEVDYTAGFGAAASDVPGPLIQAVLGLLAHGFEHREATDKPPIALVEPWLAPFRRTRL
jgi:uncharacterized phiE125 gp8 family phage protein